MIIKIRARLKLWQGKDAAVTLPQKGKSLAAISPKDEVISAWVALGYRPLDTQKTVEKCDTENLSAQELIRQALKNML